MSGNSSAPGSGAQTSVWTATAIRDLGVHTDLATAAEILDISRSHAYRLARTGELPVRVVKIGRRYLVPVAGLLSLLDAT